MSRLESWGARLAEVPPWLVLALPFLVMAAVLRGFTRALPIFHGSDELVYHLPTILQFAHQLPFPNLHRYPAAQTPLFHLVLAYTGKLTGYAIWRLRIVEVLISYLLALAVLRLLRRRVGLPPGPALLLTLLLILSPYVFGQSFRLGTDNLSLLLSVLAIDRLEAFREDRRLVQFAAAAGLIALALLTRQSTAFLLPLAFGYAVLFARQDPRRLALCLLALLLALAPTAALFANWHGLVPVGGDPSSCGLCSSSGGKGGVQSAQAGLTTLELALSTIGIYGAVLFGPAMIRTVRGWRHERSAAAPAAVLVEIVPPALAGLLLLAIAPARFDSRDAGDIWKAAHRLPTIHGTSLLFWVTVPLGLVVLRLMIARAPRPELVGLLAASFLLSLIVVRFAWQKYVDPYAVLILLVLCRPADWRRPWQYAGLAVLLVAFLAYAADTSAHRDVPARGAAVVRAPS